MSKRTRNRIIASAPPANQPVRATWDANFQIVAESSTPPVPNPAASPDSPDSQGGKLPAGSQKAGADGKPPVPRFQMSAYNGGPIRVNGYKFPVVVDAKGVTAAATNLPIYLGHIGPGVAPDEQIEQLMGQSQKFSADPQSGQIACEGLITGESDMVQNAMAHAKNGFKWQASIDAMPSRLEFIPEGKTATVNGRTCAGPCVVARAATVSNIAVVPLGADSTTATSIAASARGQIMEFAAWLKATYLLEADKLTAEQKTKFEAEFGRIAASATGATTTTTAPAQPNRMAASAEPGNTDQPKVTVTDQPAQQVVASILASQNAAVAENMDRIAKIQGAAKDHPTIAAQAVREGWTLDKVELEVLRAERKAREEGSTAAGPNIIASSVVPKDGLQMQERSPIRGGRHTVSGGRVSNDVSAVIETAGLISAGYSADKLAKDPCYGPRVVEASERMMRKFGQGLGPAGLFRLACSMAGVHLPQSNSDSGFLETIRAEFSTLSLPTILSNLMNKFLLDGYTQVDPDYGLDPTGNGIAWQKFVKRGPVNDFKPHFRLRLVGDMEFEPLGPAGEIQHGQAGEQSYQLKATTQAKMFGISREQIINDDLSAMSTIPTLFGRGSGLTVAKAIYTALLAAKQSDGATAFFTSSAITTKGNKMVANLITGNALVVTSLTPLSAAETAFMNQTDPYGNPAGISPQILLVPPALANTARVLYQNEYLPLAIQQGGSNVGGTTQPNSYKGKFIPVVSTFLSNALLANYSASTWYLLGGPQQAAYPIEAGFLNGQEMPIVERSEMEFDRLGVAFRGFIDFGVSMSEPRSAVKNTA